MPKFPMLEAGVRKAISSVNSQIDKIDRYSTVRGKYLHLQERLNDALPLVQDGDLQALKDQQLVRLVAWVTTLHWDPDKDHFVDLQRELNALGFSYLRVMFVGEGMFDSTPLGEKDYWPC